MARPKVKTLFNKNHITITKTENILNDREGITSLLVRGYDPYYYRSSRIYEWVEVVKESPLGFYYTTKEQRLKPGATEVKRRNINEIGGYEIKLKNATYKISYVYRSGENEVKITEDGLRPWQVVSGDGSMPDHLIMALKETIDKIITIADDNKLTFLDSKTQKGVKDLKDSLYRTMFGNVKGIRFQTDAEKILSHGFDLKSSFRNC